MMQRHQSCAEVNGARLYYEEAGTGEPLVLVHGFSLDTRMWEGQFDAFAGRYWVIRYDLRGFGRSAVPAGEPYRHVDDLSSLLDYLNVERAHLVGLSLGGGVVVDFALTYPAAVRSLIPVDAALGGYRWSAEWDASIAPVWKRGRAGDIAGARELWLKHALFAPALERPEVGSRLSQMISEYSGWHWVNRDPERSPQPPAIQRLGQIRLPTLVILGAHDLPDFHRIADLLQSQIPKARKAVLPGVGHLSNMEAPGRFNEIVLSFLAELQQP